MNNKVITDNVHPIIKKILQAKYENVAHKKLLLPLDLMIKKIEKLRYSHRNFKEAIKRKTNRIAIIGECKKAVPVKGVIRSNYDLENIVRTYHASGVIDAISVLTEEKFFLGDIYHISRVRETVSLPILRKDFIIDEYQVYESAYYGADAILLICLILDKEELKNLYGLAKKLSLEVIFEVHSEQDIQKIIDLQPEIIGINNRDLLTLNVNLVTTERLRKYIPKDVIVISESGIISKVDLNYISKLDVDAVLIGTYFMQSSDISKAINLLVE